MMILRAVHDTYNYIISYLKINLRIIRHIVPCAYDNLRNQLLLINVLHLRILKKSLPPFSYSLIRTLQRFYLQSFPLVNIRKKNCSRISNIIVMFLCNINLTRERHLLQIMLMYISSIGAFRKAIIYQYENFHIFIRCANHYIVPHNSFRPSNFLLSAFHSIRFRYPSLISLI